MNTIIFSVSTLSLAITILILIRRQKNSKSIVTRPKWMDFVSNFKTAALKIDSAEQLELFLSSNNEKVKQYETDYAFLVAFNSLVREVRQKLKNGC